MSDEPTVYRFRRDEDGVLRSYISSQGGTKDGIGWADNDQPYPGFSPLYFNQWEYARLLLLRGVIIDAKWLGGRYHDDLVASPDEAQCDLAEEPVEETSGDEAA